MIATRIYTQGLQMIKNKLVATLSALSLIGSNFSIASETSQETAIVQTPVDRLEGARRHGQ